MTMRLTKYIAFAIAAIMGVAHLSHAYVFPGKPNCPWAKPENKWSKYINRDYGDAPIAYFSVHFIRSIGNIEKGQCYTVNYEGGEKWKASGKIGGKKHHTSQSAGGSGGDPLQNQLNVWGVRLSFNEAGEVTLDKDGALAGQLYCRIGNECWK